MQVPNGMQTCILGDHRFESSRGFLVVFFFVCFLLDMLVIKTDKASCIEMFNLCLVSTMKTKMEVLISVFDITGLNLSVWNVLAYEDKSDNY